MTRIALDIDHVGLVGPHVQRMVSEFRELGFRVTDPVELMGTGPDGKERSLDQQSAHFIFGSTYVELSEVTRPGPDHHLAAWLGDDPAIRILILRAADIAAVRERAVESGQAPTPVGEASRALHYANGAVARFRWLALPSESFPEALCGYVQHLTPELVFRQEMNAHPNGAVELTGMTLHAADTGDAERRFRLLSRADAPESLEIRQAEGVFSGFTALHLRTRSLDQSADTLAAAGKPYQRDSGKLTVQAPGVLLQFSE
ncbi:MAG: VOC family protein [Gammaproteobacteria bacterium]|nr:VOC family protein [Gammaproteobacteria bacterium]